MSTLILNKNLAQNKQSRTIQPIDFSERWSLCHHLACVVNHIARAGSKQVARDRVRLDELKKAEWFLVREITNKRPCVFSTVHHSQDHPLLLSVEATSSTWGLSSHLQQVIFYVTTYQKLLYRFPSTRVICLKQALKHLREAMKDDQRQKTSLKRSASKIERNIHG